MPAMGCATSQLVLKSNVRQNQLLQSIPDLNHLIFLFLQGCFENVVMVFCIRVHAVQTSERCVRLSYHKVTLYIGIEKQNRSPNNGRMWCLVSELHTR